MKKLALLTVIFLGVLLVVMVYAQDESEVLELCTQSEAEDALELLSDNSVLETFDDLIEAINENSANLETILYNTYLVRQSYFVDVQGELPKCFEVDKFDRAFSVYIANLSTNFSIIALEATGDRTYRNWSNLVDNMDTVIQVEASIFTLYRSLLELAAE